MPTRCCDKYLPLLPVFNTLSKHSPKISAALMVSSHGQKLSLHFADRHFESSPDQWTHRVAKRYRDRAPRRIKLPNGRITNGIAVANTLKRRTQEMFRLSKILLVRIVLLSCCVI